MTMTFDEIAVRRLAHRAVERQVSGSQPAWQRLCRQLRGQADFVVHQRLASFLGPEAVITDALVARVRDGERVDLWAATADPR